MSIHIVWDIPRGLDELQVYYEGELRVPSRDFWELPFYNEDFKLAIPLPGTTQLRFFNFEKNSTAEDLMGLIYSLYSGYSPTYFGGFTKIGNNFYLSVFDST